MEEIEKLKHDLGIIFSYARTHCATLHPNDENEMIEIINLKRKVFNKLFDKEEEHLQNGKLKEK